MKIGRQFRHPIIEIVCKLCLAMKHYQAEGQSMFRQIFVQCNCTRSVPIIAALRWEYSKWCKLVSFYIVSLSFIMDVVATVTQQTGEASFEDSYRKVHVSAFYIQTSRRNCIACTYLFKRYKLHVMLNLTVY